MGLCMVVSASEAQTDHGVWQVTSGKRLGLPHSGFAETLLLGCLLEPHGSCSSRTAPSSWPLCVSSPAQPARSLFSPLPRRSPFIFMFFLHAGDVHGLQYISQKPLWIQILSSLSFAQLAYFLTAASFEVPCY